MKIQDMSPGQWFTDGSRKMMKIGRWENPTIKIKFVIAELDGKEFSVSGKEPFKVNAVDDKGCFCCCPNWVDFDLCLQSFL